ncbi:hypothetical protein NIES37_53770 [Tolypothrix tenuis PCC 7101]|uniref:Uncharacterized protein n=1 Tax=Tolypothrix tenuis PCC 7101 TaxID=231146 RepID=A0A1Z4N6N3_9CYAN|nr:hypothetical protein NIES37_53770 [Tolypothrix tenuis PCC 7101]BAZ74699.1 hypothetical protein NIES50_32780 [Aulosira laxa NIES-50]
MQFQCLTAYWVEVLLIFSSAIAYQMLKAFVRVEMQKIF